MVLQHFGGDGITEVMKLGEYPPFGAPISARIQKLLDKDDLELYRKGSRSEAQGLGIGAATYFRRIVDSHWKLLVKELHRAAEKLGHADLAVFDNALQAPQFSAAVEKLKDAIPDKLLILNGENPLTLLYSPVAGELLITPPKRAFWRNGSASLISRMAAIHSDRDARWRPGRPSLPLHRSCRGDREPFGWDRACSWNRTEVRNRRFPSCSAVGRGSIGR